MNEAFYLKEFQSASIKINKKTFEDHHLQIYTGVVMNSVAIKVYKPEWSNDPQNALTASSRIFFSIWINEETIKAAIANAGYDANEIAANPESYKALPKCCKKPEDGGGMPK